MENRMHLTPGQLAARWQVSEKSLERWRRDGTGPEFMKLGGRVLYRLDQVEAHECRHLRSCTSQRLSPTRGQVCSDDAKGSPC
ncbi:MAG TPA: helix-turn-helix domain-containing protein [Accumulibacter sp.]|nr:helix-turn-helix domain-containing protein [Accumulibacter sp.]